MRIKKNEGFLKKWLILGNVGHIQGEPGVFYNTIKYMLNKKTNSKWWEYVKCTQEPTERVPNGQS